MWVGETIPSGEGETSQKKKVKELKQQSAEKEPTVWIGKSGVTDALLGQINRQLDANEIVKVKVHKTSPEDAEVAELAHRIAEEMTSEIVDVRGRTFTIYRQKKKVHREAPRPPRRAVSA
jgi:RNA-binding protein